jgi:hypothetical protein
MTNAVNGGQLFGKFIPMAQTGRLTRIQPAWLNRHFLHCEELRRGAVSRDAWGLPRPFRYVEVEPA